RARQPAAGAAARRAARRARPKVAAGDAAVPQEPAAGSRDHVRVRHARPGRGVDDERPPCRLRPWPHRAGRLARGGVRAAGERLRRRVRRRLERHRAQRQELRGSAREDPYERRRRVLGWSATALLVGALAFTAAGCGSNKKSSSPSGSSPSLPTKIGPGEGKLSLIAWEGYTQPQWVKPFQQQTGCQVTAKYAG